MKIIFCRHHSICEPGILKSLTRLGHDVVEFMNDREPQDYDKDYMFRLATLIQQTTDVRAILSVCSCLTSCSLINSGTAIRETVSTHCLHVISSILTTLQYLTRICGGTLLRPAKCLWL